MSSARIGVLALQGDVHEHQRSLVRLGVDAPTVRRPEELASLDALVVPGGESTTIVRLAHTFGLLDPLRSAVREGLPVYGSCAGMILLADRLLDAEEGQATIGGLDVTVRRNAFGRQVDSFEMALAMSGVEGESVDAVFIRAPAVEEAGSAVEVLARIPHGPHAGTIVAVRQGSLLATSFHPEIGGDLRIHQMFVEMVRGMR